jgi:hypothetical protein
MTTTEISDGAIVRTRAIFSGVPAGTRGTVLRREMTGRHWIVRIEEGSFEGCKVPYAADAIEVIDTSTAPAGTCDCGMGKNPPVFHMPGCPAGVYRK